MTAAKYLSKLVPQAQVVLIERNPTFWSGPMSNKWLIDIVNTDFLNHDMLAPSIKYGYSLVHAEVTAIERDRRCIPALAELGELIDQLKRASEAAQ